MNNQSLLRKLLALMLALPLLMSAQEVTFWNFSDTEMFPSDTLWETTTLHGVTFVTDGSSADRVPIFQSCSSRTWTSADGAEELMFTQRLKINGKSSTAYRWLYFTANPGDTIEVWGNSTSSSSARTLTFKSGGYNGVSWGDVDLATGSNPSYGYVVYGGSEETVMAMVSSGSWYTYAIRLKPNPDFGGGDTPPTPTKRWFFKHGWGDGLDASWEWRELYPNADSTLYIRQDVYGGTGCNYADNALGINSVWVPLSDLTLIDNNPSALESTIEKYDVMSVMGNCASMDVLRSAGVEEADLLFEPLDPVFDLPELVLRLAFFRLLLLLAQAPLLGALISLVADGEQFKQYEMTKSLLFALSCSAFWVGMLNSIQEICKERTVLKREYMTGLSLSAYVLSKAVVLGVLCLFSATLLPIRFHSPS